MWSFHDALMICVLLLPVQPVFTVPLQTSDMFGQRKSAAGTGLATSRVRTLRQNRRGFREGLITSCFHCPTGITDCTFSVLLFIRYCMRFATCVIYPIQLLVQMPV